ncbi:hypothetical protein A0H81_09464 [Grifola frondosa]|uniref:Tse2 ADP-ribosyltransferase toxin domain-containing protein n=1 Tax=Grifola frondosa TaxID=5627 RepID=A0A1C7M2E8_GRIFR|nr:hypothetical protein A0H81_09464 [Grifola frondosa]
MLPSMRWNPTRPSVLLPRVSCLTPVLRTPSALARLRLFSSSPCTPEAAATRKPAVSWTMPLLGRFDHVPVELFRINWSEKVVLRDYESQMKMKRTSYDLHIQEDGFVHPKPGDTFEGPNGASVRPNGPFLQELIRGFKGKNTVIYRIPEGIPLPPDLVLLHEHSDNHSIQCKVPMTLSELNSKVTKFVQENGEKMTKMEFVERYPFM